MVPRTGTRQLRDQRSAGVESSWRTPSLAPTIMILKILKLRVVQDRLSQISFYRGGIREGRRLAGGHPELFPSSFPTVRWLVFQHNLLLLRDMPSKHTRGSPRPV